MSWRDRLWANPFGTVAAAAAVVLGALGAVLGAEVSQGMTNSLSHSADLVAHLWGAAFTAGGLLNLVGLYRHRSELEIPGLWIMTGGYAFYSLTVTAGLGLGGMAAGIISGALTIGCFLKTRLIMTQARRMRGGDGTQ